MHDKIKDSTVLHFDQLCNAGPYWSRKIASMSGSYIYFDSNITLHDNPNNIKESALAKKRDNLIKVLSYKPDYVVCGGGFWNSTIYNNFKDIIKEYLHENKDCISFGYWGDGNMSLIKDPVAKSIFCSSIDAVQIFKNKTNAYYYPHPVETKLYYPNNKISETYDWNFIGTNYGTTRKKDIAIMKKVSNNYILRGQGHLPKVTPSSFEETADIFRQSKITFNITDVKYSDLDMHFSDRILMAMCCGKFVLANYTKGMEKVFKRGVHLDWYCNNSELKSKINYYLQNDVIRKKVAANGYKYARRYSLDQAIPYFFMISKKNT